MSRINVYAENLGWLFEDLKDHFRRLRINGFEVVASDRPLIEADAWVALRTHEATLSPDPRDTVVCLHDLHDNPGLYGAGGMRRGVRNAGALVLSHPEQRRILHASGVSLDGVPVLERPLGALAGFRPRQRGPERFSVGWIGRNHPRKRLSWFVEAMCGLRPAPGEVEATLIGLELEPPRGLSLQDGADRLRRRGIPCRICAREVHPISDYPRLYRELDCVVITSTTEAGPLPLFEALATGLPVVSTPVGWAPNLAERAPRHVRLARNPAEITALLEELGGAREEIFEQRLEIAGLVEEWRLDDWMLEVVDLAGSLS